MLPLKIRKKLWTPQKEAFNKMAEYISAFQNKETTKSGLIHMPTGSGKTGIIACLARFEDKVENILIVSPRIALREQLYREVNTRFFEKINFEKALPKEVSEITVSNNFPDQIDDPTVFITTIQKLYSFSKNSIESFSEFISEIDLLIFDEGHYEPALSWSATIRKFDCPKIMFTATPFRNDFKPFNIDENFVYSFPYHEAVKLKILRSVEIIPKEQAASPLNFINDVLEECVRIKDETKDENLKIIVRCDDSASIRNLAIVLIDKDVSFIGIHENFSQEGGEEWEYKKVPNPNDTDALIWIHQYKLLEGIDDPRFRILATYKPLNNTRQVIQQIGRIIRNPGREENQFAYFIDHSGGEQQKLWEEYLEFDEGLKDKLPIALSDEITNSVLSSLPKLEYVDGRFRRKFQLFEEIEDIQEEVKLPLNCNLIETLDEFSIENFYEFLEERFANNDSSFRQHYIDDNTYFYFYIAFNNTKFLARKYFVDVKLNLCVFSKLDSGYLAFYDSSGFAPIGYEEVGLGKAITPKKIKKLIKQVDGSRLVFVSLKNSNLGNRSISSHSFSASSIEETTPFLDDHSNILSSFVGYSKETEHPITSERTIRRYLGIANGRLSENKIVNLGQYLLWIKYINSVIANNTRKSISTFTRYSSESGEIVKTNPRHVLLDFTEFDYLEFKDAINDREVIFTELSNKVTKANEDGKENFNFQLTEGENTHKVNIKYDPARKKYLIDSPTLSGDYYTETGEKIISYVNNNQLLRVIPEANNTIYIHGNFYNPSIKIGSSFNADDFQVGKIINTDPKLSEIGSEKGGDTLELGCKPDSSGWNDLCLFNLVDSLCKGTTLETEFGDPDLLICDDMGTEVADFILSDTNRVVFIHVKGKGNNGKISHCSASSLQEVCAQAIKNIQYLSMFNSEKPKHLSRWDSGWQSGKVHGSVSERLRKGNGVPNDIWETLQKRINNPLNDKEVWLFLGRTLSKSKLIENLGKRRPVPEAIQAAILLHGTMTSVSSIGAKMRIFCHP